jgi:hypothetical protein
VPRTLLVDDDHLVFGDAAARVLRAAGFEVFFLSPDDRPRLTQANRRRAARLRGQARSGHRLTPERGSFPLFFGC